MEPARYVLLHVVGFFFTFMAADLSTKHLIGKLAHTMSKLTKQ